MGASSIDYAVSHQSSSLIAASVTATTAGTAIALLILDKQRRYLAVTSALNQPVMVTVNGVNFQYLPGPGAFAFDAGADGEYFNVGDVVGVYYTGSAPTTLSVYGTAR